MIAASTAGGVLVPILLGLIGTGGVAGTLTALFKLAPDANTAAVTQAQGAMEIMAQANATLEKDRDAWRERAVAAEKELERLRRGRPPAGRKVGA